MGKKGSWLSAIKKVFSPSTKDKLANGSEKKSSKEKKGRGILKHGETKSFIPLFREPSSIEKILGEADQQKILVRPPTPTDQQPTFTPSILPTRPTSPPARITSPRATSPRITSPRDPSPRITSPRAPSPRVTSPRAPSPRVASSRAPAPRVASSRIVHQQTETSYRPEPTLRYHHLSATKIQAVYRGYIARRSFKALRGLVRLQGVVRGQNVKRQTMNAMKHMQLLVRVQTQIQSRRIQMLENQALQRQAYKNKELQSTLGKWTLNQPSEAGDNEYWDDSVITKEEREARLQRKVEALIKRERAMAYAYSHQLWKGTPRSDQTAVMDVRSGGFPWWCNWLERQLPSANPSSESRSMKNVHALTPSRQTPTHKPSPRPHTSNSKQSNLGFDNLEVNTPRSTRSTVPMRTRQMLTPSSRTPPTGGTSSSSNVMKFLKPRASAANSPFDVPLKDDDSLMSCPPFSVPNYMTPTVSAKAKVRPNSNPKDRVPGTPGNESKRRFSFPLTPNMGSFKWNKGSSTKDSTSSQRVLEKHHHSPRSVGDFSVDSTLSMPATVGRKPFNRFV